MTHSQAAGPIGAHKSVMKARRILLTHDVSYLTTQ